MLELVVLAFVSELVGVTLLLLRDGKALETNFVIEASSKVFLHVREMDMIMRALWPRKGRLNIAKVQFHHFTAEVRVRLRSIISSEKTLGFQVLFNHIDTLLISAGQCKVVQCFLIYWEEAHSGAIFWRHIRHCSSVGEGELLATGSKEFNELSDNSSFPEHGSAC